MTRWPNDCKAVFNLQFDDFSAKDGIQDPYDYGGNLNGALNKQFLCLLEKYPYIKVNLFVIADPIFVNKGFYRQSLKQGTWCLSRHPHVVDFLKSLPQVECSNHGLHHYQDKIKYFLKCREFEFKTKAACIQTIQKAEAVFSEAELPVFGFKPSGWSIGHNTGFQLIYALKEFNFDFVCLSTPVSGLNWDKKRVSFIYPEQYQGLLNIPQNLSLNWPVKKLLETIDYIVSYHGVMTLQGHYNNQYHWMSDGIGDDSIQKIKTVLNYLKTKYPGEIYFATLSEIAKQCHK